MTCLWHNTGTDTNPISWQVGIFWHRMYQILTICCHDVPARVTTFPSDEIDLHITVIFEVQLLSTIVQGKAQVSKVWHNTIFCLETRLGNHKVSS